MASYHVTKICAVFYLLSESFHTILIKSETIKTISIISFTIAVDKLLVSGVSA